MTRVMYDLQQLVLANYDYTNVSGSSVEDQTANPDILLEGDYNRTPPTNNANGRIIFVHTEKAVNVEQGPSRTKVWFIDGYIQHQNLSIFDDATVLAMLAEVESVLNVYNTDLNTYQFFLAQSAGYNDDVVNAMYDFTVEANEYGVRTNV